MDTYRPLMDLHLKNIIQGISIDAFEIFVKQVLSDTNTPSI